MSVVVDFTKKADRPTIATGALWNSSHKTNNAPAAIVYAAKQFVCIDGGGGANPVEITQNGYVWDAPIACAAAIQYTGLAYGEGVIIAVAQTGVGNQVARSVDYGATWTPIAEAATLQWQDVCYCGNQTFLAVAQNGVGNQFMISTDLGLTWSSVAEPANLQWVTCWANTATGVVIAVAQNGAGNQIARSTNRGAAGSWASIAEPATQTWRDVTWGNNTWVAVGLDSLAAGTGAMYSEDDGATWASGNTVTSQDWVNVAWGYDKFSAVVYIVGSTNFRHAYTANPRRWLTLAGISSNASNGRRICYGKDRFVMVGQNSAAYVS